MLRGVGALLRIRHALSVATNDPVLIAYAVKRPRSDKKPVWTRIGCAYPHETGNGLTVVLDAVPSDGRVILLERDEDDDARLQRRLAQLNASIRAAAKQS